MAQVRIPGLGHSLMEDGTWQETDPYLPLREDRRNAKRLAAKRKSERLRDQASGQVCIWDDMAPR